ncbi:hypothetical protein Patl1_05203 [Pistacia atlantica]|uniref:Uncharacterized protein n=1 Tax=Pistacia atlantica TaxID=434234 RepID=A0ACC1BWR8_9ROSI|nr:hypothetical protein Patl1_05203 [Pistacia atlantica]
MDNTTWRSCLLGIIYPSLTFAPWLRSFGPFSIRPLGPMSKVAHLVSSFEVCGLIFAFVYIGMPPRRLDRSLAPKRLNLGSSKSRRPGKKVASLIVEKGEGDARELAISLVS